MPWPEIMYGHVTAGRDPGLLEVALERLGDLARVDLAVGELDRGVAVGLNRAHLGDHVGTDGDDGDRDEATGLVPQLGHAELAAEQRRDGPRILLGGHKDQFLPSVRA